MSLAKDLANVVKTVVVCATVAFLGYLAFLLLRAPIDRPTGLADAPGIPSSTPPQSVLSWEQDQWHTLQVALVGKRMVVFASPDGNRFCRVRDVELPDDVSDEGYVCFQQEEKGNAQGARFDDIRVWEVDSGFSIAEYADATERIGIPLLGTPAVQEDFAREQFDHLIPLVGEWVCRSGYLTCADVTDGWPRIRTARRFGDVVVSFRLYRKQRNTCNWAGVALRSDTECLDSKENRIRVSVQNTQEGDELLVFPTDWARIR